MPYALKRDLPKDHKDLKRVGQKARQAIEGLVNILFFFLLQFCLTTRDIYIFHSSKVISVHPATQLINTLYYPKRKKEVLFLKD